MPIYAYKCTNCGADHDALQKINDPALTQCPACGKQCLKRQLTAPVFRLKGSGWYETDFKTSNQRHLAKADNAPKDDAPKADTAKTDSKGANQGNTPPAGAKDQKADSTKSAKDTPATKTASKPAGPTSPAST